MHNPDACGTRREKGRRGVQYSIDNRALQKQSRFAVNLVVRARWVRSSGRLYERHPLASSFVRWSHGLTSSCIQRVNEPTTALPNSRVLHLHNHVCRNYSAVAILTAVTDIKQHSQITSTSAFKKILLALLTLFLTLSHYYQARQ